MRLRLAWEALRGSYWFVPALMACAATALAFGLLRVDRGLNPGPDSGRTIELLYNGGAQGARLVLSTIAGSMITVAGVVFSVTIVALAQASAQFGPRLLRNFMRDLGNQVVLGAFTSTFLYCVLVLRTVVAAGEEGGRREFVPQAAITGAVGLAVLSVAVLIYFIHHAARSIQAPLVARRVAADLEAAIDALFPEELGEGMESAPAAPPRPGRAREVASEASGYVQAIDGDRLLADAKRAGALVELLVRPGDFVAEGAPLLKVWSEGEVGDDLPAGLRGAVALGAERSLTQDMPFAIDQLVELALRALSPGVNDPRTAATCVDWLGSGLCRLAERRIPSPYRTDGGAVRVIAPAVGFEDAVARAFDPILASRDPSGIVAGRLQAALAELGRRARRPEDRAAVAERARRLAAGTSPGGSA
jgi:uncharacterized membrane protein